MRKFDLAFERRACKVYKGDLQSTGTPRNAILFSICGNRDIGAGLHANLLPFHSCVLKGEPSATLQSNIARLHEVVGINEKINMTPHARSEKATINGANVVAAWTGKAGPLRAIGKRLTYAS
jgi:hypothetical protein